MSEPLYQSTFLNQYDMMAPTPTERPDFLESMGARWEQTFPMAAYRLWNTPDFEDEVGFDPMRDSRFKDGGRLAQVKHKFAGARSGSELEYQIDRYDQEIRALQTIKNSGPTYGLGFAMELATDPITYAPLIGQWSKGASAMSRFKAGAAVSTAYTIPYEQVRRADSMTRTNTESAMTVGSMFILSGAVSAAFGRRGGDFVPDTTPVGPLDTPSSNRALAEIDPASPTFFDDIRPFTPSGGMVDNAKKVEPVPVDDFDDVRKAEPSDSMAAIKTGSPITVTAWRGQTAEPTMGPATRFVQPGENAQYWAMSKDQASTYSQDVVEAQLNLKNPVVINNDDDFIDLVKRATGQEIGQGEMMIFFMGNGGKISFEDLARSAGHDAIVIRIWTKANDDIITKTNDAMADGQNLRAMFDQNEIIIFNESRFKAGDDTSTVGAAQRLDPEGDVRRESMRPTRTGIESMPLNPILRLLNSGDANVVDVATDLTETSGIMLNKIDEGIPMKNDSVTVRFKTTYLPKLLDAINAADDAFLRFRGMTPNSGGLTANAVKLGAERLKNIGDRNATRIEFNRRVGLALLRGEDIYGDGMTPFVNEAAAAHKQMLDFIADEAMGVELFVKEIDKKIEILSRGADNAGRIEKLQLKRQALMSGGVQATRTSVGYFPRVYDVAYLLTQEGEAAWIRALTPEIGEQGAREAWTKITNSYDDTLDGFDSLMDDIANSGAQARMLDVDDEILVPFLDFNVESVMRDYVRRMGMDIELTRMFGSVGMTDVIDGLPRAAQKDITALRDIIRGTYGRPSDPHSHLNRGITLLKNFSPLVYMGGAAVSSLPDIARPIMTEGINAVYGGGLKAFLSSNRELIMQMNRKTVREVGEALDMTLSMRAFAMADIGSSFGRQSHLERVIKNMQAPYFLLNGLNVWNTIMKEFTGLVVSQRMLTAINKPWERLSKADRERLLANGIDKPMALRIRDMMRTEGFAHQIDGFWFPELGRWTDAQAADTFKRALNQQINRTIVTPDVADRALWTQTHVGGMIAQFKSFGQASTQRVLISGLQERNANFWHGAIAMTALGMLVNEIKDFQYGNDRERTWAQTLTDGIDRAGLLAVFSDMNHALETISSNRIGIDAMAGGSVRPTSPRQMMGMFGPGASILYDFGNMASETFQGEAFSDSFMGSMRRVMPYQSHPAFPSFLFQ